MRKRVHASTTARVKAFRERQTAKGLQRFEVALPAATVEEIERLRAESPIFRNCSMSTALAGLICESLDRYVSSNDNSVSGSVSSNVS